MNLKDIPYWNDRIDAMKHFDDSWIDIIRGIQDEVWEEIINYFTRRVALNDKGRISNITENILIVSSIDRIVSSYLNGKAQRSVVNIGREMDSLLDVNKLYLRGQTSVNQPLFDSIISRSRDYAMEYLGWEMVNLGVKGGSYLWDALMSVDFTKTVKAVLINAVQSEKPINRTVKEVEYYGRTTRTHTGEYEKQVNNVLPNPGDTIENVYGLRNAIEMGLHFTRYQGGLIKTSREFCIHRNNMIFHVSQVAKFGTSADTFGGYTNKSKGIFAGKTYVYNPFYDIGGFNCRHRYFYISDEYAYRLDPSLKDKNFDLPDIFLQAA